MLQSDYTSMTSAVKNLVESIAKDGEIGDIYLWDSLDNDQRDLALMEAGFTGMIAEDDYDAGNLYIPYDRKTMVDILLDNLVNAAEGYFDDDNTLHVGYKDGSVKTAEEIDLTGIKPSWTYKSIEAKVRAKLNIRNIDFILYYNASSQPMYWVSEKGKAHFKGYGGFEEWEKGRGEKRRDYIQDDWV